MAMPTTITFRGAQYQIPAPQFRVNGSRLLRSDLAEIYEVLCKKGHFTDAIEKAFLTGNTHRHYQLEQTKTTVFDFVKYMCLDTDHNPWTPKELQTAKAKAHVAGVYGVYLGHGLIKWGMSFDCLTRVVSPERGQAHKFGFKMMDCSDLVALVPSHFVDAIEALELPGIKYNQDHNERTRDVIRMQLYEAYLTVAMLPPRLFLRPPTMPPPINRLERK